jgi:hypothetical protein
MIYSQFVGKAKFFAKTPTDPHGMAWTYINLSGEKVEDIQNFHDEYFEKSISLAQKKINNNRVENGFWIERYANGQKKFATLFKDGVKHGRYKGWDKYGALEAAGIYIDGKKEGDWLEFTDSTVEYNRTLYDEGTKVDISKDVILKYLAKKDNLDLESSVADCMSIFLRSIPPLLDEIQDQLYSAIKYMNNNELGGFMSTVDAYSELNNEAVKATSVFFNELLLCSNIRGAFNNIYDELNEVAQVPHRESDPVWLDKSILHHISLMRRIMKPYFIQIDEVVTKIKDQDLIGFGCSGGYYVDCVNKMHIADMKISENVNTLIENIAIKKKQFNSNKKPTNITKFEFFIGGFTSTDITLKLEEGAIVLIKRDSGRSRDRIVHIPSKEEWNEFSNSLKKLNIWNWKKDYDNPDILDGTQWELSIKEGSSKLDCYGSNQYPPEFEVFINAIHKLINEIVFDMNDDFENVLITRLISS